MKKIKKNKYFVAGLGAIAVFGFVSCEEEYDHTVDTANPVIVSYNPVSGVEDVAIKSNLVLTFDEYVKKGKGNFIIASETDTQTIAVTSDAVTLGGDARVVTIDPEDLAASEQYTVSVDQGIVTDLVGNEFMGIPQSVSWTFKTAGESGPKIAELSPADDSSDASLFKLAVTFTTKIKAGGGNISVYTSSGELTAQMSVLEQTVTMKDDVLQINLGAPLEFATSYYVLIDEGAIVDVEGNPFKGISDQTVWNFTTTSGSSSELVVWFPFNDDLLDASGNRFDASLGATATADVRLVTDPQRGKVVQFDAGSYLQLPKHNYLRPSATQDFSVNVWVKLAGIGSDPVLWGNKDWGSGGNPGILLCTDGGDVYNAGDPTSGGDGWLVNMNGGGAGSERAYWRAKETTTRAPSISDNNWHMVTVVIDRTNQLIRVYLDGTEYRYEPAKSLSTLLGPLWDEANDYPFCLWEDGTGHYNAGSDTRKQLAGMMDEFRIYGKALTSDEITGLYNN
ncbi:MAG: Ig-like domain-containing protein [Mangrovibacterium sp.]|nr:Ig-like domain-containing protein [Mangrovibacterium sp.]